MRARKREESIKATAKKLKAQGVAIVIIKQATGLSEATIEKL